MDEILASIRRIIAEEPVGSRPLPAPAKATAPLPVAHPAPVAASSPAPHAAPAASMPRVEPLAALRQRVGDPVAAAMSAVAPAGPAAPAASAAPVSSAARAPVLRDPPLPVEPQLAAPSRSESPFGRIAEVLGNERRAAEAMRAVEPSLPPITAREAAPAAAPGTEAARSLASDLDDLLADPPLPPFGSLGAPVAAPITPTATAATAKPAASDSKPTPGALPGHGLGPTLGQAAGAALGDDATGPRLETAGGRVCARRSIDLGAIVPSRGDDATAPTLSAAVASPAPSIEAEKHAPAKPTAQARAMDKMLTARIAGAKVPPPPPELPPGAPIVIAAMPEPIKPEPVAAVPTELEQSEPVAVASLQPAVISDSLDDLMETDDAQSALGMLAAGLAVSAPADRAAPTPTDATLDAAPVEPSPHADDVPTLIEAPVAVVVAAAEPAPAEVAAPPVQPAPPQPTAAAPAVVADKKPVSEAMPRIVAAPVVAMPKAPAPAERAPHPDAAAPATAQQPPAAVAAKPAAERPVVSSAAPLLPSLMAMVSPAAPAAAGAPTSAIPAPAVPTASNIAPLERQTVGVRTIEDMVAELLRPMLREWLAENMPRIVEKALRIELAEGLKAVDHIPRKAAEE